MTLLLVMFTQFSVYNQSQYSDWQLITIIAFHLILAGAKYLLIAINYY